MRRLEGKVAIITGAGSGFGRASALRLAAEGARVVVSDIAPEAGDETVQLIHEAKGEARFVACDVTRAADVQALVAQTLAAYGRLDVAHNNAGWEGKLAKLADVAEDDFDRVISINLKGVFLCMKHEIPAMLAAGGGSIVNTASVAGLVANQGGSPYSASKHGVIGLTRSAAAEYARKGIRVNAICPGWSDTPMSRRAGAQNPKIMEGYLARVPAARLGRAEEIAALVAYLASDESAYVNGAALPIDGAWTAQ